MKQKRKNSKTKITPMIPSSSNKNNAFKINLSSKNKNNNNNIDKIDNDKNINPIIKIGKTENLENNDISLLESATANFGKGFYNQALKDALKSIEINENLENANYIAFLCCLEMYDIDSAEKFLLSQSKNKKCKNLLDNKKKEILTNSNKYKSYPKYIYFLQNLYKNDSFFPKIEIQFYTDDYRGVVAKNKILKDEVIISIPRKCLITLEVVYCKSYGKKISEFMYRELNSPKHCLLSSFLLFEENNPLYKYYFDLLPNDYSNFPIFYTKKELEYLKGSPFLNLIMNKRLDMQLDYNKLCEKIENFDKFSFEKFCKARLIVSSRIFGITINNNKTDALVPFADLLNHRRPRQTQWYFDNDKDSFIVQAVEEIFIGQEIFDSYGKKTNSRFLLNYGFALENNEMGEYPLSIVFNSEFPLFEVKKKLFKNKYEFIKTFNLNNKFQDGQILELISHLRFLFFDGNIKELFAKILSAKYILNEDMILNYYFFYPINKKNEIQVLKYLKFLCEQALAKYPTSIIQDQKVYKENKNKKDFNFNYRNCLLLLISEKNVLMYYIKFCDYCLKLLKSKKKYDIIVNMSKEFSENDCKFNFYLKDSIFKLISENENINDENDKNYEKNKKSKEDMDEEDI